MKYCQNCKARLQDEVEICPVCGEKQLPEEELKKKKVKKVVKEIAIVLAVIAVIAAVVAAIMILGKEPEKSYLDEVYTENVTDPELIGQFAAYVATALPEVWGGSDEETEYAIEYYQTSFPEVAAGFQQMKEIKPVAGELSTVSLDGAVKSEEGSYKLTGEMKCTDRKVNYELVLAPSAYVDALSFALKEETFLQKAREFLLKLAGQQ